MMASYDLDQQATAATFDETAYLRANPARWQPYWRWVVLAEWLGREA
jgi:hypothetical protein